MFTQRVHAQEEQQEELQEASQHGLLSEFGPRTYALEDTCGAIKQLLLHVSATLLHAAPCNEAVGVCRTTTKSSGATSTGKGKGSRSLRP